MRVLLVNYEYPPVGGGAATATQQIARSLVAQGHSAIVLTSRFGGLVGVSDEEGVRVIRLESRRARRESASVSEMVSYALQALRSVRRLVREEKIDGVIAFFSIPSGPVAQWAHWGTGVPYIVSLRGGDVPGAEAGLGSIHRLLTPVRRGILRAARAVVANSPGLKALAEKSDPIPVRVIPNGVDTTFFTPAVPAARNDSTFRLLFVGRFQSQKNLPWVLERIAELKAETARPFSLDLVGDGPQRQALVERVNALQLGDTVRFHSWQDRAALRSFYQSADLVINPSLYEGMPNVVLEAMACGRPVLASRVPGNETVVLDGVTGTLFSLGNASEFRDRIRAFLLDPALVRSLGAGGRAHAESKYSWTHTTRSYLELFASNLPIFIPS